MEQTPELAGPFSTPSAPVALFGEAEKGDLGTMYYCRTVEQLYDYFGQPPRDTEGLHHAVQAILYGHTLLYYRVREEGMNSKEYLFGLQLLKDYASVVPHVGALFLPRVGLKEVIDASIQVCHIHHGLLLMREADFFDYLTDRAAPEDTLAT